MEVFLETFSGRNFPVAASDFDIFWTISSYSVERGKNTEHIRVTLNTLRHHKLFCKPVKYHLCSSKIIVLVMKLVEQAYPQILRSSRLFIIVICPLLCTVFVNSQALRIAAGVFIANYSTIAKSFNEIQVKCSLCLDPCVPDCL